MFLFFLTLSRIGPTLGAKFVMNFLSFPVTRTMSEKCLSAEKQNIAPTGLQLIVENTSP